MRANQRLFLDILVLLAILAGTMLGLFRPIDSALTSLRFHLASRPVSGEIVFVAIDPVSLRRVGVWPWPRSYHAKLVDQLVEMDASDIFFDVDFSSKSNPIDDTAFAEALDRAGGYVGLAAFAQFDHATENALSYNLPIPEFARNTQISTVNVRPDDDGIVRRYPDGGVLDGILFPSVASALAYIAPDEGEFLIDYSIDARTVDQISYADLMDGLIDPDRISGKQVIVGASALELRDSLAVPRFGILSGALVQLVAAETLKQGRVLKDYTLAGGLGLAALAGVIFMILGRRYKVSVVFGYSVLGAVGVEVGAYYLQALSGILIVTVPGHIAILALAVVGAFREVDLWHLFARKTKRDHDMTRGILDRVIADNFDGVVVVGADGNVLAASRLAGDTLGFDAKRIAQGVAANDVLPSVLASEIRVALQMYDEGWPVVENNEMEIIDAKNQARIIEYVITLSGAPREANGDESEVVACLTFRDITDRRTNEKRLNYLATHDPLTGALSRGQFAERVMSSLRSEDGKAIGLTLGIFKLSRFKTVNDTLGHGFGDALLKQLVHRLKNADIDAVARLGGDSFAIARAGVLNERSLEVLCADLLKIISDIYLIGAHRALVGAQLGVTDSELSGTDPDTLIAHAAMALSAAKQSPINNFAVYTSEMDAHVSEVQDLEIALGNAIKNDEFSVMFQPQCDLETGELVGVEALLRWTNPKLGIISPDKFIRVAEETGVILDLGRWVLIDACKQAMKWPKPIKLAVNVSPTQFEYGDLIKDVKEALELTGIPPERLELEITEGVFISKPDFVKQQLNELKKLGLRVALDDFGTGFSSLSYLGQLPIDKIKIDKAFVNGLPQDQHSIAVVRAVMTLSESLGKSVVAEGIENADQAWMLHLAGCQLGQGYYYGKPLAQADLIARMDAPETEQKRYRSGA